MYFKSLNRSFFVQIGRGTLYVKCFENGNWLKTKTDVGISDDYRVKSIQVISSSVDTNGWMQEEFSKKIDPLNHPRGVIISDFEVFEMTLRAVLRKLTDKWYVTTAIFIMNLDYEPEGGITEIERRAIRDSAEHCGAKEVYIISKRFNYDETILEELYSLLISASGKSSKRRPKLVSESNFSKLLE
ncbi:MAG: rod shape-determining protein [Balneolaceae bacterium]|nr:rod shape-determining protein [Balneolaceae bacterium]MBO6547868.1 rod shape-determining protein [Balneolaceae bacterium]MBO6648381.1 rod shape-determining protein [Balneolaceae bacterium]